MECQNTDPYWSMDKINDTTWGTAKLMSRKVLKDTFFGFGHYIHSTTNSKTPLCLINVKNSFEFRDDIHTPYNPPVSKNKEYNPTSAADILNNKTILKCKEVESPNGKKYFNISCYFRGRQTKSVHDRFGNYIPEVSIDDKYDIQHYYVTFQIPKRLNDMNYTWYRILDVKWIHHIDFSFEKIDWHSRNFSEESKSYQNASNYEKESIVAIDKNQMQEFNSMTSDIKLQENSLYTSVNLNFPEKEDIAWVQKKKAQTSDDTYDHRGSPLTTSQVGIQTYTDAAKLYRRWFWRAVGKNTHMTGRGFGWRDHYQARMLRGSVGDFYGAYWNQMVGRKRIAVFSERLTGRIQLPKPSNAFIAQPPNIPIGWNIEVLVGGLDFDFC